LTHLAVKFKNYIPLILKFFSVGMIATLVHSAIFSLCIAAHLTSPQWANLLAYVIALMISYIGQRYWTFSDSQIKNQASTILRFLSVSLLGFGLNAFWVYAATVLLSLSAYLALIGIGFLTPLMTFALLKFWVFTHSSHTNSI
jgi:putative flippase GtrA